MMRKATEITVNPLAGISEGEPRCEIVAGGSATGCIVSGAILEAAVQWRKYYLLFLTDDVPYEEMLRICLFTRQWQLVDSAALGCIYSTGAFSDLKLLAANRLQFRFIGDTDWNLEFFDSPRFRLPWLGEPSGIRREFGFSRHFLIRGNPKPAERL